jgi:hypothetical protein
MQEIWVELIQVWLEYSLDCFFIVSDILSYFRNAQRLSFKANVQGLLLVQKKVWVIRNHWRWNKIFGETNIILSTKSLSVKNQQSSFIWICFKEIKKEENDSLTLNLFLIQYQQNNSILPKISWFVQVDI